MRIEPIDAPLPVERAAARLVTARHVGEMRVRHAVDASVDGAGYVVRVEGGAPAQLPAADRQVLARLFVEADWVVDWA